MLRAKRKKQAHDDDSSTEGNVSQTDNPKKKKQRTNIHTPVDSESESDSVIAESPSSTAPPNSPRSKHTKDDKQKGKVKSSPSKQELVPENFYKKVHKKVPKGMLVSFPPRGNAFSASPWGLKNNTTGMSF
jgi:hypothetical protein